MTSPGRWRFFAGLAAIAVLVAATVLLPRWGFLRQRAVVEAARTFSLSTIADGAYEWSVRDGRHARGDGLMRERVLAFDRADLVELELVPDLVTGANVAEGQVLATIHTPHLQRRVEQRQAERDAIVAERALLAAGARPEEIEAARRQVDLARSVRDGERTLLERTRLLAEQGAVSAVDLEVAEQQDRIRSLEIALAEAQVNVARSAAQPEALSVLDAQISALNGEIDEIQELLADNTIASPISGTLEVGGNNVVLRVYDTSTVYLRVPVPETDRLYVENGAEVAFVTASSPGTVFQGTVVDVGEDASPLNGLQIFWASVEIANPERVLRSGMSGVVRVRMGQEGNLWDWLHHTMVGY